MASVGSKNRSGYWESARGLIDTENVALFILFTVILSLFCSALYDLVTGPDPTRASRYAFILVICIVVGFVVVAFLKHRIDRMRRIDPPTLANGSPKPTAGLVLLVSNKEPCVVAMDHHDSALKHCWLVHSSRSTALAAELAELVRKKGAKPVLCHLANEALYDTMPAQDLINEIFADLPEGLAEDDVTVDFTGLTVPVSVGAAFACLASNRNLQYVPAITDEKGIITGSAPPVRLELRSPDA